MAETSRPPIPTDWVDINKGGSLGPNYRSRLVCQETRGRSTIDVEDWTAMFAANTCIYSVKIATEFDDGAKVTGRRRR